MASSYSWETSYIGVRNGLDVPLFNMDNGLHLDASFGVSLSTILKGQQKINNMVYDISDHSEFCGITGWTDAGLKLSYDLKEDVKLALGYTMSENFVFINFYLFFLSFFNCFVNIVFCIDLYGIILS